MTGSGSREDGRISRRTFLHAGIAAAATAGGLGAWGTWAQAAPPPGKGGGGGGGGTALALHVPPVLQASEDGWMHLTAATGMAQGISGLMYNKSLPGPTVEVRRGGTVRAHVHNELSEPTTVHWHGLVVPTAADGQPHDAIPAGKSFSAAFPIVQRASLNWYHPHPHLATASQVAYGLAGAFIIRDDEEDKLSLPGEKYEVPLIIRDANIDRQGNLTYSSKTNGFLGNVPLVNGTRDAGLEVDRSWYRFRILNGANARIFKLTLSPESPFRLIGNDGGLLPKSVDVAELEIAPAERLDVLVDCTGLGTDNEIRLLDASSGWTLLKLVGTGAAAGTGGIDANSTTPVPTAGGSLSSDGPQFSADVSAKRTFSFDGMTRINGQVYDMDLISFRVRQGDVEEWEFRTNGNAPHPVHIHGASFQVISRTGGRNKLFPWEAGWKDTVLLHDREVVTVRIAFTEYAGRYLMHCHKLEHEDAGMMLNFEVLDPSAGTATTTAANGITGATTDSDDGHGH